MNELVTLSVLPGCLVELTHVASSMLGPMVVAAVVLFVGLLLTPGWVERW